MIKLLIMDMDNTLIDLAETHYEALNRALGELDEKYIISREEHESKYNGLPTMQKLNMLTVYKSLPISDYQKVWQRKQDITAQVIEDTLLPDQYVIETLARLSRDGYKIAVASNSIKQTVFAALNKTGILNYVSYFISNEDVKVPKPDPEMFIKVMDDIGNSKYETMIFEDSKYGLEAAYASGAYVYEVKSTQDILYDPIKLQLDYIKDSKGFYR